MVKILALSVVRSATELPDPVICSMATELSSFGFFQRPVSFLLSLNLASGFLVHFLVRPTFQNNGKAVEISFETWNGIGTMKG